MSVVPPLRGTPLYRYIPGIGRAVAVETNVSKYSTFGGGVLVVDRVHGNDSLAAQDPFNRPFFTLVAALAKATSGMCVYLMSGAYQGPITIPTGVAIRGVSTQTVSINTTGVTSATTLVTMGIQTRLEDVTLNLTSSADVDLIGVDFPSGTPQTAKLRTMVVNVTSAATGLCAITGVRSAGTSSTDPSSSQAIRAATVNVSAGGTGVKRGLLVSAANRFSIRDTNIYVSGAAVNNVGVETTHASAICELKAASISAISSAGDQTQQYDINRTAGQIILSATDLVNNSANGNSFKTSTESANTIFGATGNFNNGQTYFLLPGVPTVGVLPTSPIQLPRGGNTVLFNGLLKVVPALTGTQTVRLTLFKNNAATLFTILANAATSTVILDTISVDYKAGDTYDLRILIGPNNLNGYKILTDISFY